MLTSTALRALPALLLLWAAGLGAAAQFAKIATIFPAFQDLYPEAGSNLGFLLSLISVTGTCLGLVAGVLVGRLGPKRLLVLALLIGAALSALQALILPLWLMMALRVAEGVSHLIIVVAAPTLMTRIAPPAMRALAMTVWSTFFGVAFALGSLLFPHVVDLAGVPGVLLGHGAYLVVMAMLVHQTLPQDPPLEGASQGFDWSSLPARHVQIYSNLRQAVPALGWFFYTLTFVSILTVLGSVVPADQAAWLLPILPLTSIATALLGGFTVISVFGAVRCCVLGFGLSALFGLALVTSDMAPWAVLGLFACLGLIQSGSFAAIPELNPQMAAQAQSQGAMAQMGNLGNLLGAPVLLFLTDAVGAMAFAILTITAYGAGMALHLTCSLRVGRADSQEVSRP